MLLTAEINNRNLRGPWPAGFCLGSEDNHKTILLIEKLHVNDINQVREVLIVLCGLSDKTL